MGCVYPGLPDKIAYFYRNLYSLEILIETGTYMGYTAKRMSRIFKKVITIEMSDKMYNVACNNLKDVENVELIKGDSREILNTLLDKLDNVLFWLDAHYSGGETYGKNDECPLVKELEIIFSKKLKNFVILIDDARLFLAPP